MTFLFTKPFYFSSPNLLLQSNQFQLSFTLKYATLWL